MFNAVRVVSKLPIHPSLRSNHPAMTTMKNTTPPPNRPPQNKPWKSSYVVMTPYALCFE